MSRPISDDSTYRRRYIAAVALAFTGAAIGSCLPDLDVFFRIPGLVLHRSLLFHSFLIPALLYLWAKAAHFRAPEGPTARLSHPRADPRIRLFCLGTIAALAVHLCFDLFPRSWWGFARLYAPVWGQVSPLISGAILLASVAACLYLACRLFRNLTDVFLGLLCVGGTFGVAAQREPRAAFWVFLLLFVLSLAAFGVHSRRPAPKSYAPGDDYFS